MELKAWLLCLPVHALKMESLHYSMKWILHPLHVRGAFEAWFLQASIQACKSDKGSPELQGPTAGMVITQQCCGTTVQPMTVKPVGRRRCRLLMFATLGIKVVNQPLHAKAYCGPMMMVSQPNKPSSFLLAVIQNKARPESLLHTSRRTCHSPCLP